MRKREKRKIDETKLPKTPLGVRCGSLVEAWLWIRLWIERRPSSVVLGNENRDRHKGKYHDNTLDRIRKCDTIESTNAFKDQNENHDDNDWINRVWVEPENAVEGRFKGNDLGSQINNGRQDLQKYYSVSEHLRLESVRDEIGWRLVVSELADLSESKTCPHETPTDTRHSWEPTES